MSSIKFEIEMKKVVFIKGRSGAVKEVGTVEEYKEENGTLSVTVKLFANLDKQILDIIAKDPRVLNIVTQPGPPQNILFIA